MAELIAGLTAQLPHLAVEKATVSEVVAEGEAERRHLL